MIASLLLFAAIAQASPSSATTDCVDAPLRIFPPAGVQPPVMPFGAAIPAAQTVISVVVGPDGHLTRENILGSSGYSALDLGAYTLIQRSSFSAKTVNCKAVTAYQFYVVDFSQTPPAVTPASVPTP